MSPIIQAVSCSSQVWRQALKKAIDANKSLPNAKYFQLATNHNNKMTRTRMTQNQGGDGVMEDNNNNNNNNDDDDDDDDEFGYPSIRTVVFRGFLDRDQTKVTFVTDKRSKKIGEFGTNNKCELCWYFPKTREQFRIRGFANVITNETTNEIDRKDRLISWKKLRPGARGQFAWPEPGQVRLPEHEEAYDADRLALGDEAEGEIMWPKENVLDNFCLVTVDVNRVDHLELKGNKRHLYSREKKSDDGHNHEKVEGEDFQSWKMAEVCP